MLSKLLYHGIILIVFALNSLAQNTNIINFSPLPSQDTNKQILDFKPLTNYLENKLAQKINYIHKNDYQDIITGFKNGEIDIAYLGPLPFMALKQQYPFIQSIATVNQTNGSSNYRCVLTKFKNDSLKNKKALKIALTRPLSTCGYFMTQKLLKENFDLELKEQKYNYMNSHSNALIGVLEGKYLIAGVKESIAEQYDSIGMEIIAKSELIPGCTLVVNTKSFSQEQIQTIEGIIFNVDSSVYQNWGSLFSKGFKKTNLEEYKLIDINLEDIPLYGNM